MGSNDPLYNASPERAVRIKSFYIDIYETSNNEYLQFVESTGHRLPTSWKNGEFPENLGDHPVVGVSWEDAKMYCQHLGKRLLTERSGNTRSVVQKPENIHGTGSVLDLVLR